MNRELLLLVDALAREKNVPKEIVFTALEMALASATKKRFADDVALTEVDFSHGRFSDKLIPKGELVIVHAEGFRYVVLLVYIN